MSHLWQRLDRVQHGRGFRIIASVLVVLGALAVGVGYVVQSATEERAADRVQLFDTSQIDDAERRAEIERQLEPIRRVLSQDRSPQAVAVGIVVAMGVVVTVVWLGLALTYLLLALGVLVVAGPLILASQWGYAGPLTGEIGRILMGAAALTVCFTAAMEALRVLLSLASGPVLAVARNVLAEAVRMKISLVFIVMLIFGLAAVPMLLNEGTPLRYRMQAFLQYGTAGAFWVTAVLTILLSAATINFEQRDRIIWQTVTKPVAAWKYLLGKWLGVIALNAALLAVSGSAIFLFAEYLRQQPAKGEESAYVPAGISAGQAVPALSEDRRILHNQVLQARVARDIDPPLAKDSEQFETMVERYIQQREDTEVVGEDLRSPELRPKIREDLYKDYITQHRSIDAGRSKTFTFSGLEEARERNVPLVLRYKVESGANRPDEFYDMIFVIDGRLYEKTAALAQTLIIDDIPADAIDDEGRLEVTIVNGGHGHARDGSVAIMPNPRAVTFPPGGLELSYSVGGYRMNFVRVVLVLWIKLAFLSMLAIACSTALSFPVACLTAFGAFFAAESAVFLQESLEVYNPFYGEGVGPIILAITEAIGGAVVWIFGAYAGLKPTEKLVAGELVPWASVMLGVLVLGVWSALLFALGWVVFRSRELAMYSGN